ncbi:two component transcriptional regulator, winged helix family [Paenibacillus curdlanolyticus YK9]|uniref:Two component transcriptional regulator, winged helix family n=1 Tax=Paenibacillus curdlanolyticus YK9 TaxID=717606 RepID=E0IFV3_9BACL|nr:response regulator transcription factor [Paenibacillus curdlanolyticus]EFM08664.1 two component transcriptional regulator, winged helix family [Paenibacillus curdlanolyticus YK9]
MSKRILVADDEPGIASAIAYALQREGFEVQVASDGEEALAAVAAFQPHVLLLDVMMPKLNGFDVCRRLPTSGRPGVILLTVKNDIVDKVLGLELGADDYMTKPFDIRELLARTNALLRRLEAGKAVEPAAGIEIGGLLIRTDSRTVTADGSAIELTPKEFDLLALLLGKPDRVFSRDELLELVWGIDYEGGTRTVDIHVQRLRKKLGAQHAALLQTVFGVGYKGTASRT